MCCEREVRPDSLAFESVGYVVECALDDVEGARAAEGGEELFVDPAGGRVLVGQGPEVGRVGIEQRPGQASEDGCDVTELDITDAQSAERAVAAAVACFVRIDVLVDNAGNFFGGFFEELSPQQVRSQIETNRFGPMTVTRAVLPVMRKQGYGPVISISSTAGAVGGAFGSAYAASKFGLEGWMEGLAGEVEPYGIRTMIVEPGLFGPSCSGPSRPRSLSCRSTTPSAPPRRSRPGRR
jgi:NAD(P)-dependent dehydrogenase (short-subunit alcohol dehydrogenase family)